MSFDRAATRRDVDNVETQLRREVAQLRQELAAVRREQANADLRHWNFRFGITMFVGWAVIAGTVAIIEVLERTGG